MIGALERVARFGNGGVNWDKYVPSAAIKTAKNAANAAIPSDIAAQNAANAYAAQNNLQAPTTVGDGIPAGFDEQDQQAVLAGEHLVPGSVTSSNPNGVWTTASDGTNSPQDQQTLAADNSLLNNWGNYQEELSAEPGLAGEIALAGSVGALTAGTGAVLGSAAGAGLGATTAGTVGTGAASGAVGGVANSVLSSGGKNIGQDALIGAIGGGLGAAASPLASALGSSTGIGNTAASAITKGAIGAGTGALGAALTGGNASNGALVGGIGGAASGALGAATGNKMIGNAAGTIGGALASKYLTSPTTTPTPAASAPTTPTPAAKVGAQTVNQSPPATASTTQSPAPTQVLGTQPMSGPTPVTSSSTTNIGPYNFSSAGLGYQPMSQVNPGITNYNTYGQGPEASFFQPTPGT